MKKFFSSNKKFLFILITLAFIFIVGGSLRFWQISAHPVSFHIDEAAIAYNSYSILKTGKDEWGDFLPLSFRSFNDSKAPVLIYLMTPAIALFGLNEFGVRFTVALIGTLTLLMVFFLTSKITKNKTLALLTTFSLAISPWHIYFSRATFESIVALFFTITGAFIFLRALEKEGRLLWLSGIFFSLSLYTYHAEKIFTPILVLGMIVIYRKELLKYKSALLKMLVVSFLILAPLMFMSFRVEGQARAKMAFLTQDEHISYQLHQRGERLNNIQRLLDNNLIMVGNFWIKRYLNYWDPSFLFFNGLKLTSPNFPDTGLFYFFEIPLFIIGLWLLFFEGGIKDKKAKALISLWLLAGPLAASLANNEQHALRNLTMIPAPHILVGMGSLFILGYIKRFNPIKKVILSLLILFAVVINILYLGDLYFIHLPVINSEWWDYGLKEASLYAWEHQKEYQEIIFDPAFGTQGPFIIGTPYLYALIYGKYDPHLYQTDSRRMENGQETYNFANFTFRPIYWPEDRNQKSTLFVGSPWSLPMQDINEEQVLKRIYFKNEQLGFLVVKSED